MSTLYTDNIRANNASQITLPTGNKIVGTDTGSIYSPGQVLQTVVYEADPTTATMTSVSSTGSWVNTGNTATITPMFATSKVLVNIYDPMHGDCDQDGHNEYIGWRLYKGTSTVLKTFVYNGSEILTMLASRGGQSAVQTMTTTHLDSPATTSAVTYKTMINRYSSSNRSLRINWNGTQSMVLQEIAQ
tara:strand:- start:177 stop:740 length:564 start_codon:yes stop_codon:yes gene_type:complete